MDPISIITGLASVVPQVVGWIKGPKAQQNAEAVVDMAKKVTGIDDPQGAVDAVKKDPSMVLQLKSMMMDHEYRMRQEDNRQLEIVNQTIRAETVSQDGYNRKWRATFGYCVSAAWLYMFVGLVTMIGWAIFKTPDQAGVIISAVAGLVSSTFALWGIALSILGVTAYQRSKDKELAAGLEKQQPGLMGGLAQVVGAFKK